jgi:hypothetical protein
MKLPSLQKLNPDTLYDVIMEQVDPRLCTYNLHKLDTECVTLSKDALATLHAEFKQSFAKFKKVKAMYFIQLQEELQALKQRKLNASENESKADEEQVLHNLELLFN